MGVLANLLIKIGADTKELGAGLDKATRDVKRFGAELESAGMRLSAGFSLPMLGVGAAALVAAGKMEQTTVAFTTLLKSADAAKAHIEDMKKFAMVTPFQFEDVTKMSKLMQAMGTSVGDVIPHLRIMGDAVSAMGGGNDVLERVVRSMSEIGTRGKITGEQLRELSRAGIPALEAVAQKLGITVAETQKQITDGMVDAKTATDALFEYMNRRFAGGMKAQSETLLGAWSNIKDKVAFTLADIGAALLPMAKGFVNDTLDPFLTRIKELAEGFKKLSPAIQEATLAVSGFMVAAPILVLGTGMLITNITVIGQALSKLTLLLNPVTLGILAVASAAAILTYEFNKLTPQFDAANTKFSEWLSKTIAGTDALHPLQDSTESLARAHELLEKALETGAIGAKEYGQQMLILAEREKKSFGESFGITVKMAEAGESTEEARKRLEAYNKTILDAEGVLGGHVTKLHLLDSALLTLKNAYLAGSIGLGTYTKSFEAWNKAIEAAKIPIVDYIAAVKSLGVELTGLAKLYDASQSQPRTPGFMGPMPTRTVETLDIHDPIGQLAKMEAAGLTTSAVYEQFKAVLMDAINAAGMLASNLNIVAEDAAKFGLTSIAEYDKIAGEAIDSFGRIEDSALYSDDQILRAELQMQLKVADARRANKELSLEDYRELTDGIKEMIAELDGKEHESIEHQRKDRYDLGRETEAMAHRTFDQLERGLAKNIVEWKGWSTTIKDIGKTFATDMLSIMLKGFFKPLEDKFASLAGSIGTKLGGLMGGGGGGIGIPGVGGAPGIDTGAAGGASSLLGGASSLMGTIGAVSAAVGAVSSIIGNFQMAGMNKSLDLIENYTRYLKIGLVEQGDSLLNDSHMIRNMLSDFLKWNSNFVQPILVGISGNLDRIGGSGGSGKGGITFNNCNFSGSPQENADAIFKAAALAGAFG
jgi:tape measure domain-containing protein